MRLPRVKPMVIILAITMGVYYVLFPMYKLYHRERDLAVPVLKYNNWYIITLLRDRARHEHVLSLIANILTGAHLWPAIDGTMVSDTLIQQWKTEGYLGSRLKGFMDPQKPYGKPKIRVNVTHPGMGTLCYQQHCPVLSCARGRRLSNG